MLNLFITLYTGLTSLFNLKLLLLRLLRKPVVIMFTLKNFFIVGLEHLSIQALLDLTGTRVISSKPIAVLSGANRTQIFKGTCASHLIEQTPPVSTWGTTFILVPVPNQRMGDLYRFVAKEPQTTITLGTGKQIRLQHPGDFGEYLLSAGSVTYAKSDKPVLVGHYATEQEYYTFRMQRG